jgi:hypothetical protein
MLNTVRKFFSRTPPRRNPNDENQTGSQILVLSPASGLPLDSPSPKPKRRNINPSPGTSRGALGLPKASIATAKKHMAHLDLHDDIDSHTLLDPPQLHSTTIAAEAMLFPQPMLHDPQPMLHDTNKSVSYRSKMQVDLDRIDKMKGLELPLGMSMGPCKTIDELQNLINNWAKNPSNAGGSFSVKRFSSNAPSKCRGGQKLIMCSRGGPIRASKQKQVYHDEEHADDINKPISHREVKKQSAILGCPWEIWTEETTEGWVVSYPSKKAVDYAIENGEAVGLCHNHKLVTTNEERMTFSTLREIPKEIEEYAKHLHECGCLSQSQIYHSLVKKCMDDGITQTFTQSDIMNKYRVPPRDAILDCTNLAEHLKQWQLQDPELDYAMELNGTDGSLELIFFVLKDGKEIWKQSSGAVILYDTKHGTNRYGLKLGCFVSIDNRGMTRVVAGSFVQSEDEASFTWAYKKFEGAFQSRPVVLFTDSDAAMAAATKAAWPTTIHLLRTFHLWKNFWQHIRHFFIGKEHAWREVADMWWRLCKNSDEGGRVCFDEKFNALIQLVKDNANMGGSTLKEQWAACYTWQHRTFGIHSTQRAEAIHSAINVFCCNTSTILDITKKLEQLAAEHTLRDKMEHVNAMLRGAIGAKPMVLPALEKTASMLATFPRIMLNAQSALLLQYECIAALNKNNVDVSADEKYYLVTHSNARGKFTSPDVEICTKNEKRCTQLDYDLFNTEVDHGMQPQANIIKSEGHKTSLKQCSCQYPRLWGLPCRHMLRVMFHLQGTSEKVSNTTTLVPVP